MKNVQEMVSTRSWKVKNMLSASVYSLEWPVYSLEELLGRSVFDPFIHLRSS